MVTSTQFLRGALVTLLLALAGCADDGGGDGDGGTTTTGARPTGTGGSTMPPTTTGAPGPGGDQAAPQYINGTVSGIIDCTLVGNGAPAAPGGGSNQMLPAGSANATYELTVGDDPTGTAALCLFFDDAAMTGGASGSVPADATSFTVYADRAPSAVPYSVKLTLVAPASA